MPYDAWVDDPPSGVVELLVSLVQPVLGRFYDPCCGSGAVLAEAVRQSRAPSGLSLYGQEAHSATWSMCQARLEGLGVPFDIGGYPAPQLASDHHEILRADRIASCAINWRDSSASHSQANSAPPSGRLHTTDLDCILYSLKHLARSGIAALALPPSSLWIQKPFAAAAARRRLVEEGTVECIILLPPRLYPWGRVPICVWVLRPGRISAACLPGDSEILFINASGFGTSSQKGKRALSVENVQLITETYRGFTFTKDGGSYSDIAGFCRAVSIKDIEVAGFSLNPAHHVV